MLKINFIPTYDDLIKYNQTLFLDYKGCSLVYFVDDFSWKIIIELTISHLGFNHREQSLIDMRDCIGTDELNILFKTLPKTMYRKLINKINAIEEE